MNVTVIGTGYVGLISGVCLADKGHRVVCVDRNPDIVNRLNASTPTIYEKGLDKLLNRVISTGCFSATTDVNSALNESEIVLIAVGTPSSDGSIDLSAIAEVCREVGKFIKCSNNHISVVVKSTVVPSTTDSFIRDQLEKHSEKVLGEFGLGMNPEFLREGNAIEDFSNPDRIVFGFEDDNTLKKLEKLYESWDVDKLRMNTRSAEFVKYANNYLLATQISAINEIANVSSALGCVDFKNVTQGIHLDKRWNPISESGYRVSPQILTYLKPGCGFGGSCFPKDVEAFRSFGMSLDVQMRLSNAVLDVNDEQPFQVGKILEKKLGVLKNMKVLVLGLAFKPDTDDVRESPALKIIADLITRQCIVSAHDPIATANFKKCFDDDSLKFVEDWRSKIDDVDIIVCITSWSEYLELRNYDLSCKTVFDTRAMLIEADLNSLNYLAFGNS